VNQPVRICTFAALGALLLLGTAAPALAHGRIGHGGLPPVAGMVTYVGGTKLQVSTATGVVTVGLTAATHVVRVVSGSTLDLHPNQMVRVHVVPGTNTVDVITIEGMGKAPGSHGTPPHHAPFISNPDAVLIVGPVKHRTSATTAPPTHPDAQVVSVSASSITIRIGSGNKTYAISSSVTVTKLVTGSQNDLAIGEMVQVLRRGDGTALAVTIMGA
jgi:hypothetical protein